MPLYELFCLARPRLPKAQLGDIIKLAARTVLDKGGLLTDVKSFGERELAYEIRKPGAKYNEVKGVCGEGVGRQPLGLRAAAPARHAG